MHSVSVMVVNLFYTNPHLLPVRGFGYLIPRSIPYEQNPERALGVIFDSDAIRGQDTATGTKITVMLGGHWWDGWSVYPDEEQGLSMARSILRRHLNIHDEPVAVNVSFQKDCIPQYTVGHHQRLRDLHSGLLKEFNGLLKVAGNSYSGVGVNDCIRGGLKVVSTVVTPLSQPQTGLERILEAPQWVQVPKRRRMAI